MISLKLNAFANSTGSSHEFRSMQFAHKDWMIFGEWQGKQGKIN